MSALFNTGDLVVSSSQDDGGGNDAWSALSYLFAEDAVGASVAHSGAAGTYYTNILRGFIASQVISKNLVCVKGIVGRIKQKQTFGTNTTTDIYLFKPFIVKNGALVGGDFSDNSQPPGTFIWKELGTGAEALNPFAFGNSNIGLQVQYRMVFTGTSANSVAVDIATVRAHYNPVGNFLAM